MSADSAEPTLPLDNSTEDVFDLTQGPENDVNEAEEETEDVGEVDQEEGNGENDVEKEEGEEVISVGNSNSVSPVELGNISNNSSFSSWNYECCTMGRTYN